MITDSYSNMISGIGMRSVYCGGGGVGGGRGGIWEEEIRSDPAYVEYYYSNVNLNHRLPPPLLSKEDWWLSQRGHGHGGSNCGGGGGVGGIGDRRKMMSGYNGGAKEENRTESQKEWGGDGLIGLTGLGLGTQKSIADMIQVEKQ